MIRAYIEELLDGLHINRRYTGRKQLVEAVLLAMEDEGRLLRMDRLIYAAVAEQCGGTSGSVSRNIRTVATRTWDLYPELLQELAGYPLDRAPTASEMVELILTHVQRTCPQVSR